SMQGEKNNGFDILYHNMKHGVISVKSLQDLFRESATTEDLYAKHLTKLAKQAANSSPLGTFAPMFEVVRVMSEKLSSCHMDIVHKLHEIIKDLAKYLEEQKNKHKQCININLGRVKNFSFITGKYKGVAKKFHAFVEDLKMVENSDVHATQWYTFTPGYDKSSSRYRYFKAKIFFANSLQNRYDIRFITTTTRFQEIEEAHLRHMKSVLDNYILSFENANVLVNQVHQEFRRQVDENTIASLIKQYSESKGTGFEKPGPLLFEEWDPATLVSSWSSLSSVGGTPMDSFASSRGPSPLTLMHGDPIPIAVAFTETAPYKRQFKPPTPLWCMVKITGDMQMSFPAGIVRAFTSNPNPAALSFKVKGVSNIKDFAPNASLIMADSSQTEVDSRSFFFNMSALVSHVKKMTDSNPNSPYYNIPVMSYQVNFLSSAAGYDMVPLHISSTWVCDMQSTDICIDYKYVFLAVALHTPVKNIQVIVPVDGGVTNHQSVPQATW
uniref:MHD domain-containing protein n=1 Tax=Ciona savignyi TaxID=51511 RepID=H2YU56_CIOSA